ncbi:hypothetical protein [Nesterenkonia haasae]|uniref:hypothetical protein n=1 Tax=Nesterenkonia haasae TaxID=2587813 RepID=UPI0013911ED0|nr:hypothetical protein [Nesterenkonia haasae]NDK32446.1 hypothetical protein [Nesterenkonia haasae]
MHQSGQFISAHPLPTHYGPDWDGFGSQDQSGKYLPAYFPVLFMAEAVLLATRLQGDIARDEEFTVQFRFESEEPWELVVADPRRSGFHRGYKFTGGTWEHSITLPSDIGTVDFRQTAAEAARELLLRFGWIGVTTDLLRGIQDQAFD